MREYTKPYRPTKYPQLGDTVWLETQIQTRTLQEIADELGRKNHTVHKALRRQGIEHPSGGDRQRRPWQDYVGETFGLLTIIGPADSPWYKDGKRPTWVTVRCECGETIKTALYRLINGTHTHCGCLSAEHRREGAKIATASRPNLRRKQVEQTVTGYRVILVNGRHLPEHRWVMEQMLGRVLLPFEKVHHINGVRDDNRPENLELWSTHQPSGQRVEDKIAWALEVLEMYGADFSMTDLQKHAMVGESPNSP